MYYMLLSNKHAQRNIISGIDQKAFLLLTTIYQLPRQQMYAEYIYVSDTKANEMFVNRISLSKFVT